MERNNTSFMKAMANSAWAESKHTELQQTMEFYSEGVVTPVPVSGL